MSLTAAQLIVRVKADTLSAQQGLGGLASMLGSGGVLGLGAAAAVAAVAGIGIAATKMAGDFQSGMVSIVTGAGESQSNLKLISDGVLQLAKDTGTSTSQLTAGLYMIESGGYHGAAALDILKNAAEGAKVGNADLGVVADATDTILKNFGESGMTSANAVNTLIATVANGKTHMQDLADSLAQILPTAAAAHVGLNDAMAAMATMTGEGVPAANAATYLRQTMIALMAPSSSAAKAMEAVGLSTAQVADEMHKSLPDTLKMITDAIGKKFPEGSAGYMAAIKDISGGSRQMQGMLDLTGAHMKTFNADVGKIAGATKQGGDSINGWALVQGTFNQKMSKLSEVVQTAFIQLGTKLLPVAGQVADYFAGNLPKAIGAVSGAIHTAVSDGQALIAFFEDTGPKATAVKAIIVILAGAMLGYAASAIPAAVVAIGTSVVAFGAQAVAAGAAAVAVIAATWPFILVGAAIAAVVVGIYELVQHWSDIQKFFGNVGAAIGGFFSTIGTDVQKGVATVLGWFSWLYNHNTYFKAMVDTIIFDVNMAKAFLSATWQDITGAVDEAGKLIYNDAVAPFVRLLLYINGLEAQAESAVITAIVDPITGEVTKLVSGAESWGANFISMLVKGITSGAGKVGDAAKGIAGNIAKFLGFHSPAEAGPGADADTWMPNLGRMLSDSLTGQQSNVGSAAQGLAAQIAAPLAGLSVTGAPVSAGGAPLAIPVTAVSAGGLPNPAGGSAASVTSASGATGASAPSGQPIILQVDGRTLARVLAPYLPDIISSAAGVRTF